MIEILSYGSQAILIRLKQSISEEINEDVFAINQWILDHFKEGIEYTIPSYSSIVVGYNPQKVDFDQLKNQISSSNWESKKFNSGTQWNIPVCYEPEFAPDRELLCEELGLSDHQLIDLHYKKKYRVYSCGFLPGFPYLGKTDDDLFVKRKEIPRKEIVKGSVGLANNQTGIYPVNSPGGWQIIGRTPLDIFRKDEENPFIFSVGDKVSFLPITKSDFKEIQQKDEQKKLDINAYKLSI